MDTINERFICHLTFINVLNKYQRETCVKRSINLPTKANAVTTSRRRKLKPERIKEKVH
uniref:Uncharacterized protein n=1 Tax=Rhizophora mucronata TaxID=61149 RepID=A0A2P2PES8_RHIMU